MTYELDLIENVIDILVKMGFNIFLKPHQRETVDKYAPVLKKVQSEGVKLSHQKMPVETLFHALDSARVIGYTSTALLNAKNIIDIPAITIIDMLAGRTND